MRLTPLSQLLDGSPLGSSPQVHEMDLDKLLASPTSSEVAEFSRLSTPDKQVLLQEGLLSPEHLPLCTSELTPPSTPGRCYPSHELPPPPQPQPPPPQAAFPQQPAEFQQPHAEFQQQQPQPAPPQAESDKYPSSQDQGYVSAGSAWATPPQTPTREPTLLVDMQLLEELEQGDHEDTTEAFEPFLYCEHDSGPYVLSRLVQRLGRPNLPKLCQQFKTALKVVYKKAKQKEGHAVKKSFGDTDTQSYAHSVMKQVLRINDKKVLKVSESKFTKVFEKTSSDYMVYCSLNLEEFSYKSLSLKDECLNIMNNAASHIVLIQDGNLYCKYLKKSDNRNRRLLAKTVIQFDEDGQLTSNSYLKKIHAVYKVVSKV